MRAQPALIPSASPPRSPLASLQDGTVAVGIDIGGTKTQGVAVDSGGRVLAEAMLATQLGLEGVAATATEVYRQLRSGLPTHHVVSVGVGVPGNVDTAKGTVANAVNLRLRAVDLGRILTGRFGVRTRVENDVNAAAFGAYLQLGSVDSLALLNLGTGLAAGFVINGGIYRGAFAAAGEIGHLPLHPGGPVCACGQRGCLELYLSGAALRRATDSAGLASAEDLFARAADGVPGAIDAVSAFIGHLAWAVQLIAITVDVAVIVLSGGITALGPVLLEPLAAHLRREAERSAFIAALELAARVRALPAGYPVSAVGVAARAAQAGASTMTGRSDG